MKFSLYLRKILHQNLILRVKILLLSMCLFSLSTFGQKSGKNKKTEYVFGAQIKPIIPINYFGAGPVDLSDTLVNLSLQPKLGYSIGMIMRADFTKLFSFETGINYVRRNYDIVVQESKRFVGDTARRDTTDHSDFGLVAYQIPLQALVYIRLSGNLYMNVSGGLGIDMYASNVQSIGENYLLQHVSLLRKSMNFSLLANVGFEYRTPKIGRFYVGTSFVNPFKQIAETRILYFYGNTSTKRYTTPLKGTYITLDFRYFFADNSSKKK